MDSPVKHFRFAGRVGKVRNSGLDFVDVKWGGDWKWGKWWVRTWGLAAAKWNSLRAVSLKEGARDGQSYCGCAGGDFCLFRLFCLFCLYFWSSCCDFQRGMPAIQIDDCAEAAGAVSGWAGGEWARAGGEERADDAAGE